MAVELSKTLAEHWDKPLVIHYPKHRVVTDDELLELSSLNKALRFERTARGDLIVMSPTGSRTSDQNSEINMQLRLWAKQDATGRVYDSSGGFRLPNGAIRSPDACWVANESLDEFTDEELTKFPPLCPEFVLELRSASDSLKETQAKMQEYIENGAKLGWLVDPAEKKVHVYTPGGLEVLDDPETVSGADVLDGFELDLLEVW